MGSNPLYEIWLKLENNSMFLLLMTSLRSWYCTHINDIYLILYRFHSKAQNWKIKYSCHDNAYWWIPHRYSI